MSEKIVLSSTPQVSDLQYMIVLAEALENLCIPGIAQKFQEMRTRLGGLFSEKTERTYRVLLAVDSEAESSNK